MSKPMMPNQNQPSMPSCPVAAERRHSGPRTTPQDAALSFDCRKVGLPEPLVWSDSHLVGVDSIDAEHRALIAQFNTILAASKSHSHAELGLLLEQLGNSTDSHFASEERLMAQFNYAQAAQHRLDHQKLLEEYANQVDDWRNRYISAELLCRFMYRWLLGHVMASDMALGEAINQQTGGGESPAP